MSDLIKFLQARLAEDEAAARVWPEDQRDWKAAGNRYLSYASGSGEQMGAVNVGGDYYGWERIYIKSDLDGDLSGYLALHDPARVLREAEAKRAILELHKPHPDDPESCGFCLVPLYGHEVEWERFPCRHLRHLAAIYSDHPAYQQEWAPDPT